MRVCVYTAVLNFRCFQQTQKNSNSTHIILGFLSRENFTTGWSDCPCRSSGNNFRRIFQKTIKGFYCSKINGPALKAALQHSLCRSEWKHKHRVFPSELQSLPAATCSLEEKSYHTCYTNLVLESKRLNSV